MKHHSVRRFTHTFLSTRARCCRPRTGAKLFGVEAAARAGRPQRRVPRPALVEHKGPIGPIHHQRPVVPSRGHQVGAGTEPFTSPTCTNSVSTTAATTPAGSTRSNGRVLPPEGKDAAPLKRRLLEALRPRAGRTLPTPTSAPADCPARLIGRPAKDKSLNPIPGKRTIDRHSGTTRPGGVMGAAPIGGLTDEVALARRSTTPTHIVPAVTGTSPVRREEGVAGIARK